MTLTVVVRVIYIEDGEFLIKVGDAIVLKTSNIPDITAFLFKMNLGIEHINRLINEALVQVRERMGVLIVKVEDGDGNEPTKQQN